MLTYVSTQNSQYLTDIGNIIEEHDYKEDM